MYTPASSETAAWAISTDSTSTGVSDKWGFSNQSGLSDNFSKADYLYMNINVTAGASAMPVIDLTDTSLANAKSLSLNLIADTAGKFYPRLTYVTEPSGGIYEIYLVPDSEVTLTEWTKTYSGSTVRKELAKIDGKYRIGRIDAYGNGAVKTAAFPKREITVGDYHLVILANGVNDNWVPDETIISGRDYVTLKLVSFAMQDETIEISPFLDYKISLDSVTETALTTYAGLQNTSTYADIIDNKELTYINWESNALDLTKTDGFDMLGRSGRDNSPMLTSTGFNSEVNLEQQKSGETEFTKFYDASIADGRPFFAIRLNVPYTGKYKVSLRNNFTSNSTEVTRIMSNTQMNGAVSTVFDEGAKTKVYFGKADDFDFAVSGSGNTITEEAKTSFEGNYFNSFTCLGEYDSNILAESSAAPAITSFETVVSCPAADTDYYIVFDITKTLLNEKYWKATSSGTATCRQLFLLSGIELTPVAPSIAELEATQSTYDAIVNEDGSPAEETTPVSANKSYVKILSSKDESVLEQKEYTPGDTVTYTATGDDFLYWAQGLGEYKTVISENPELSVKAEKGAMYIYAVYAKGEDTTEVVFYNGNKAEISRKQVTSGDTVTMEALPHMAGFKEAASAWTCVEDGKDYAADATVTASGKMMRFVAKYPDVVDESFTVTAENGTVDNAAPTYGDKVTVTAPLRKDNTSTLLFNYWEKDGEIVSFNQSYSFRVFKDTTVTAVYKEYRPLAESVRKIILGTRTVGNETAVVAEFINVTDAVEKGIMFGGTSLDDATHKVSMKGTDSFFSVINDVPGDAKGYAILSNGNVIYSE